VDGDECAVEDGGSQDGLQDEGGGDGGITVRLNDISKVEHDRDGCAVEYDVDEVEAPEHRALGWIAVVHADLVEGPGEHKEREDNGVGIVDGCVYSLHRNGEAREDGVDGLWGVPGGVDPRGIVVRARGYQWFGRQIPDDAGNVVGYVDGGKDKCDAVLARDEAGEERRDGDGVGRPCGHDDGDHAYDREPQRRALLCCRCALLARERVAQDGLQVVPDDHHEEDCEDAREDHGNDWDGVGGRVEGLVGRYVDELCARAHDVAQRQVVAAIRRLEEQRPSRKGFRARRIRARLRLIRWALRDVGGQRVVGKSLPSIWQRAERYPG
jgi:hypothetical protein